MQMRAVSASSQYERNRKRTLLITQRLIFQLTFGLAVLVSGMMTTGDVSKVTTSSTPSYLKQTDLTKPLAVDKASASVNTGVVASSTVPTNAGIEKKVRAYFSDLPIMAEVSRCESHFRQYDKSGDTFRGIVNNKDVGVMQINEHYHLARAKKLGFDIYTVEGNLAYARLLYSEEGTDPWSSSSPCWDKSSVATQTSVNTVVAVVTK